MIDIEDIDVDQALDHSEGEEGSLTNEILSRVMSTDVGRAIGQARARAERASQMQDIFAELSAYCEILGRIPEWVDELRKECGDIDLEARLAPYEILIDWTGGLDEEAGVLEFDWPLESWRVDRVCADYGLVEMISRIEALTEEYGPPTDPELFRARMENRRKACERSWQTTELLKSYDRPITARELGTITDENGQTASGRLRQLDNRGLVIADRSGRPVTYRLDRKELDHQLEQRKRLEELMSGRAHSRHSA